MGYISRLIKPTPAVATMIQSDKSDLAFGAGDIIYDWTPFQIPVGTVKLESISLLVAGEDGSPQTARDIIVYFAKGNADGTAPSSLGAVNATANGTGFYNNILGHTILDVDNYENKLDFASVITGNSTNQAPGVGHTDLVLESEAKNQDGTHTLYVALIGGGSYDGDFSTGVIADGAVTQGAASNFDVTSGGTDANQVFSPGDVILVHDSDTPIGTVKSATATNIVLEDVTGVAIANQDEIVHATPIKIRLGFQY